MSRPDDDRTKEELDHRSRQLDPEHDEYWKTRGYDERPDDWESLIEDESSDDS